MCGRITRERDLTVYLICRHDDYPQHLCVGRYRVTAAVAHPMGPFCLVDSLAEARAQLPPGVHRSEKMAGYSPKVLEEWI